MSEKDSTEPDLPWTGFQKDSKTAVWTGFHPAPPDASEETSKQTRSPFLKSFFRAHPFTKEALLPVKSSSEGISRIVRPKRGHPRSGNKDVPQPKRDLIQIIQVAKTKGELTDKQIAHTAQLPIATFYRVKAGKHTASASNEQAIKRACLELLKCDFTDADLSDNSLVLEKVDKAKLPLQHSKL